MAWTSGMKTFASKPATFAAALCLTAALCTLLVGCPSGSEEYEGGSDTPRLDAGTASDARFARDATFPSDSGTIPDGGEMTTETDSGCSSEPHETSREIGEFWANTQWPPYAVAASGAKVQVFGQVWVPEGTPNPGAMPGLVVQAGVGPLGSDPACWSWTPATHNKDEGNNDEFVAELTAPSASGVYDYAFRYRVEGARWAEKGVWLYADLKGADYHSDQAGKLVVRQPGATLKLASQNLRCLYDDVPARLQAMADRWAALGVDAIAIQEACQNDTHRNTAQQLAEKLSAATGRPYKHLFVQTHLAQDKDPEGIALITALPILATKTIDLPSDEFPRKGLSALLASPAGVVAMVSTHLSFSAQHAEKRVEQAQALLALADEWQAAAGTPYAIGAGDFNTSPGTPPIEVFTKATPAFADAWADRHPSEPGLTFPSNSPTARIDYLLVRGATGSGLSVESAAVEFGTPYSGASYVSDHRGVSVVLKAE